MPQTFMGIVYGIANPHVRQHVYFSDDSEFDSYPIQPGEKLIKVTYASLGVTIANGPNGHVGTVGSDPLTHKANIEAAVAADAGVAQVTDINFAEIDNTGTVIAVHMGDAALYSGPNTYVNIVPGSVGKGHTYDPVSHTFTIPSVILPPKAGVRATAVTIPAQIVQPFSKTATVG